MSNWSATKEFTVTLKSGQTVTANVVASFVHDPSYGADADGNRGVATDFMDEVYVEDQLKVDDSGVDLTPLQETEAETLLCEAAEANDEWEQPEPEYEPDEEIDEEDWRDFDENGECNCSDCCHEHSCSDDE